ncbi:MAG: hypothetical protein MUC48_07645 [Leptolyngbya sp. Prado105]|jgi:hypothetical protein|nr:hypothetical protein [Leptolyngbya sp. Prado105]
MSRPALPSTIETELAGKALARLSLEQCELLIGSDYGVILQPLQMDVRSFEQILPKLESIPISEAVVPEILTAIEAHQSIEIFGNQDFGELLRSLANVIEMEHGVLYLDQPDGIEDVLQRMFEQFYQVPTDVKASRAEIREGLSDRRALILLDHPTLTAAEIEQLCRIVPASLWVVASVERRFFWADCAIDLSRPIHLDLATPYKAGGVFTILQNFGQQGQWSEVLNLVRLTEHDFAVSKLWGAWEQMLRWGFQAAWALEDEISEAWALHQLGTLAFCQEKVTLGYDLLEEALALRTEIGEPTAIAFSQHNLSQLKALIVPSENLL